MATTNDPWNLSRFLEAQETDYDQALSELRAGRKRTHWMWYIFPQLDGLASSDMSKHYSLKSISEARAYLAHPVLGPRLHECAEAVAGLADSMTVVMGFPDDMKLKSCATLFAAVSPPGSVFERILEKYFHGKPDDRTLHLLARQVRNDE